MSHQCIEWLPELVFLADSQGKWDVYIEVLYEYFKQDFVRTKPVFRGIKLGLKRYPLRENKEATFWHMITEGKVEASRSLVLIRCERIRWIKPIIEHSSDLGIKVWENKRKSETRIVIWFERIEYLVVLAKRKGKDLKEYILPWTAYDVTENHRKKKLLKEYSNYKKANVAQY